jgi:hypothetical protein
MKSIIAAPTVAGHSAMAAAGKHDHVAKPHRSYDTN